MRRWLFLICVGAIAFTLLVSVTSVVSFAYRNPSLHVAMETAAALISLLTAQLMYGRFRRSLGRSDLILTVAIAMFAASNLLFSAVPTIANLRDGQFTTWAPTLGGVLATALLAVGAFAAGSPISRPKVALRRAAGAGALVLVAVAVVVVVGHGSIPAAMDPTRSPEHLSNRRVVGDPWLLALHLLMMAFFAAAAVGFARRAERDHDPLMAWFAVGVTLAAFARLNTFCSRRCTRTTSTPATLCGWPFSSPC